MQAFVPKARRPKFSLTLRIIDLNNIPLGVGTIHLKWNLPSTATAEHHGATERSPIQNHRASWDYEKLLRVRMTVDKNQMLQECEIQFDVFQEFTPNNRNDREYLGNVKLNLAEYVEQGDGDEGVVRRYLLQDSKINATLKLGILMRQIEGDTNFTAPPLKPATVFSGIAEFVSMEHGNHDEPGDVPSFSPGGQDVMELYDYYRRTWAASFACGEDELTPEEQVEDIWAGGDGWCGCRPTFSDEEEDEDSSDADSQRTERARKGKGRKKELDELQVREDLRSWEIPPPKEY
ncbi:hypothetical protein VTO42DRAFT_53 [Malbranchea cinnamomea]